MNTIVTEKRCSKCKEWQSLSEFSKNSRKRDGLRSICKSCDHEYNRKWRANYPEKKREKDRRYYHAHIERERARRRKRHSHSQRSRDYNRKWYIEHPEKKLEYIHKRRARIFSNGGTITSEEWIALCNKYGNRCLCCGRNDVKLTLDHIKPICLGGSNTIDNAQPLCKPCNSRKHEKVIDYR